MTTEQMTDQVVAENVRDDADSLVGVRQYLPLDTLSVLHGMQRPFNRLKIERIKRAGFNPTAVGILKVSERADGIRHIFEGQHRWRALQEEGYTHWWCDVFYNLTLAEEAKLFSLYNENRDTPNAITQHHAHAQVGRDAVLHGRTAEKHEQRAHEVDQALKQAGYRIPVTASHDPKAINAVGAVNFLWNAGGTPLIITTLDIIERAWGKNDDWMREGRDNTMLRTIGSIIAYHEDHKAYDPERLVAILADNGPRYLLALMREKIQANNRLRPVPVLYREILRLYNKGRRVSGSLKAQTRSLQDIRGEKSHLSKITDVQAEEIAAMVLEGVSVQDIADRFSVSTSLVGDIATYRRYTKTIDLARHNH